MAGRPLPRKSTVSKLQTALIFGSEGGVDGVGDAGVVEVGGVVGDSWSSVSTTTWSVEDSGSSDSSTTGGVEDSGSSDRSTNCGVGGAQISSDRVVVTVLVLGSSSVRTSLGKSSRG